jgi:hypothetical protein
MDPAPNICWACKAHDTLVPRGRLFYCFVCRATTCLPAETRPAETEPVHNPCAGLYGAPRTINTPTPFTLRQAARARAAAREKSLDKGK